MTLGERESKKIIILKLISPFNVNGKIIQSNIISFALYYVCPAGILFFGEV